MLWSNKFTILAFAAGFVALVGFSRIRGHELPAEPPEPFPGAQRVARPQADAGTSRAANPTNKPPARDLTQAFYNNPEAGVSFRYPRNYVLEEGEIEEHSYFLIRQEALPEGANLAATVLIPDDAYPNTTFEHGSLQLVIDEGLPEAGCRATVEDTLTESGSGKAPKEIPVDGIAFWSTEDRSIEADTEVAERHYAGFFSERCYEFVAVVAVGAEPEPQESIREADAEKILHKLEKIVLSVKWSEPLTAPDTTMLRASGPRLQ